MYCSVLLYLYLTVRNERVVESRADGKWHSIHGENNSPLNGSLRQKEIDLIRTSSKSFCLEVLQKS